MTTAILGLIAAITAALISRSVTISNHRQAWINGLREDLATFFTAVDILHLADAEIDVSERQERARSDALLAYRKTVMRLNTKEPLHQRLEKSLDALLTTPNKAMDQNEVAAAVALARGILKHEWDVTKYGPFTTLMVYLKTWWRQASARGK